MFQRDSLHLAVFSCKRVVTGAVAPVEVDIEPPSLPALPDAGLLGLRCVGVTLFIQGLCNFNVSNGGCVLAQEVHHWVEDGHVTSFGLLHRIIEVKFMEFNALYEVA